jgi:hypothetical protein
MSEVATGVAELGQDALTARALEPGAGGSADGHTRESACLNCGTPLIGSHCHKCGQGAHVHRSLAAFLRDFAHGVFHVEGKIWRTVPMLVLRPGRLTREYIDGRRANYLSPIALFLFTVFLLFAAIHMAEGSEDLGGVDTSVNQAAIDQQRKLDQLLQDQTRATDPDERRQLGDNIARIRESLAAIKRVQATGEGARLQWTGGHWRSDIPFLQHGLDHLKANPELAFYKLQMSAYKYSWLLIPISVPMLWLLFPFSRRFRLYDHTVFVTYSLAFMTLLAIVISVGGSLGLPLVGLLVLAAPIHMYLQLRGTYALGHGGAFWRMVALLVFAAAALTFFAVALLSLELAG